MMIDLSRLQHMLQKKNKKQTLVQDKRLFVTHA